ncbi:MAG TPA: DivIVA domain-containing protein, partial [Candidatus Krumholzibacterium sp.]|nr:DivIVA domain-containing protein [Candidatus Krumholzibacterium sp.]
EYETVLSDNKRLRERIVEIEDRLKEFKNMETNLRNTLLTAEKITAEAKENARKEAGLIVREAEVEAERAAEAIRAHTQQLRREILELKKNKDNYITRLRTLLESHQNVITGFEDDFAQVDHEIEMIGQKVEEDTKAAVTGTRMNRDRIEENDKVTWDEEQRREDVQRPSMPRPQHGSGGAPRKETSPGEEASAARTVTSPIEQARGEIEPEVIVDSEQIEAETTRQVHQPGLGLSDNDDTQAMDEPGSEVSMEDARVDFANVDAEHIEIADESDEGPDGHFNEGNVRREVARSIEDSMYPDTVIRETGSAPISQPVNSVTGARGPVAGNMAQPRAEIPQPGMQAAVTSPEAVRQESARPQGMVVTMEQPQAQQPGAMPATEQAKHSDDWKSYEVDEARQDWSNYEINAGQQASQAPRQQVKDEPSDNEVEAALSGLEEMGRQGQQPVRESVQQPPRPVQQPAQPTRTGQPEATDEQEEKSTWSMEELRRNLSNIDREE